MLSNKSNKAVHGRNKRNKRNKRTLLNESITNGDCKRALNVNTKSATEIKPTNPSNKCNLEERYSCQPIAARVINISTMKKIDTNTFHAKSAEDEMLGNSSVVNESSNVLRKMTEPTSTLHNFDSITARRGCCTVTQPHEADESAAPGKDATKDWRRDNSRVIVAARELECICNKAFS